MQRATDLFGDEQRSRVAQAVADAESKTSCEIVPVVATASGRYDRPEDLIGLWLAVLAAIAVWLLCPRQSIESGAWDTPAVAVELLALAAAIVIGFILGAALASRIAPLRRLFTPASQMREEVDARARQVFFDTRIHHTSGATGMLIYVSLFEHIAVVLADQQILDTLGQPFLDQLCRRLTDSLRTAHPADAICNAIADAGRQLADPLPRSQADRNELHDALVVID
jgi:putative membrane protein